MPAVTVTSPIPVLPKSDTVKSIARTLASKVRSTVSGQRPKVTERCGKVSVKVPGAKHSLNLTAVQHGAARLSGARNTPQATQPRDVQQPSANIPVKDTGLGRQPPSKAEPTPEETFGAIKKQAAELQRGLAGLRDLHEAEHKKGAPAKKVSSPDTLERRQETAQARIEFLLGEIDKLFKENPGSPSSSDLEQTRKLLIGLSIEVQYPNTGEMVRQGMDTRLKDASAKGGVFHQAMGHYGSVMLSRLLDPNHAAGLPDDPTGVRKNLLGHIDKVLTDIVVFGARVTDNQPELETALRDAKAALELQGAFHETIESIDLLRQRCLNEPTLSESRVPVGRLLKKFGDYGDAPLRLLSSNTRQQADGFGVVATLCRLFSESNVPPAYRTNDPTLGKLMSGLKADACQTMAVAKFVTDSDHWAFASAVAVESGRRGRPLTNGEIGKLVAIVAPELKGKFDEAMKNGKEAATARDLYYRQLGRLERIVGPGGPGKFDGIAAYKASIWLSVGLPDEVTLPDGNGGSKTVKIDKDEQTRRAEERLKALGKKNPEAAFMVAGLAYLEYTVAKLDRDVLGMTGQDNITLEHFDVDKVLKLAGLNDTQMLELGYDGSQAREERYRQLRKDALMSDDPDKALELKLETDQRALGERLFNLSRGGFTGVAQLQRHQNLFYVAANETLTNRSIQNMIGAGMPQSTAELARHTAAEAMADAVGLSLGVTVNPGTWSTLKATDSDVIRGFQMVSSSVKLDIGSDPEALDTLQEGAQAFKMLDDRLGVLMTERGAIDKKIADARKVLKDASQGEDGARLDVNPDRPAGLRTAKSILRVLELQDEIDAYETGYVLLKPEEIKARRAERDTVLDQMKGLDPKMVRRPWYQKLRGGEAPDIESLRGLRQAAASIVYIRETSIDEKADLDLKLAAVAGTRQDILNQRMSDHPEALGTMRQVIRTAVLAHWPADNRSPGAGGYEPVMHREAIEETLKSWGVEPSGFGPEISDALNGALGASDVSAWARQSTKIDRDTLLRSERPTRLSRFAETLRTELKEIFSRDGAKNAALFLVNKKIADEKVQDELGGLLLSMKDGDKIDFKSGYKLSLNTGKIPLDPSGTLGIRGRIAASALSNLVMERSGDGWKVTARIGGQIAIGADFMADQALTKTGAPITVKAGGSVGGELSGGGLVGFTETFPASEEGREACNKFIMALASGQKPDVSIFEKVSDAATNREISGKIGISAKGYAKAEVMRQPFGDDGDAFHRHKDDPKFKSGAKNQLGFGASAGIEIAASIGGKYNVQRSFNKVTISTETEKSIGYTASAGVYGRVMTGGSAAVGAISHAAGIQGDADARFQKEKDGKRTGLMDAGGDAAVQENLLMLEVGGALVVTTRTKLEYTRSDFAGMPDRLTKGEIVRRCNLNYGSEKAIIGAGNKQLAALLETDEDLKESLEALKKRVGGNDILQITYSLSSASQQRIDDLLQAADNIADSRPMVAAAIRGQVARFLKDEDNYVPTKITLVNRTVSKDVANRGNAALVKFDIFGESTVEVAELVVKIPSRPAPSFELML